MSYRLSDRVKNIAPSLTMEITAKAAELRSKGVDIIGLSAGEPDFPTPSPIQSAAIQAMRDGHTKYTAAQGLKELRASIGERIRKDSGLSYSAEEICVSNGAKHSLINVLFAILNPGDALMVPVPYWVSYPEMAKLCGAEPIFVHPQNPDHPIPNVVRLEAAYRPHVRALVLNSPSNPSGAVIPKAALMEIANWAKEKDILILSDEIYGKLIYEGEHFSIAATSEDAKHRTVLIDGVSKAYAMTGWRIGYAAGPKEIIRRMNALQGQMTSNPNTIAQYASIAALEMESDALQPMVEAFRRRRDAMVAALNQMPHVRCQKPEGAFYAWPNISDYFGSRKNDGSVIGGSMDLANYLLDEAHVAVVPGIGFGDDRFIRLSFATEDALIHEAMRRLDKALRSLRKENE